MYNVDFKTILRGLLPGGAAWAVKPLGTFDSLLEGLSAALSETKEHLASLANIRDPDLTFMLSDLEREHGVIPTGGLSEAERRELLRSVAFASPGMGATHLQEKLHAAGFTNIFVHENDPAGDPNYYLVGSDWSAVCGYETTVCGHEDAYCGRTGIGGYLLVNGPTRIPGATEDFVYEVDSAQPETWSLVFFVGGVRSTPGESWFIIEDGDMEYKANPNLVADGDMQASGTAHWEAALGSVVGKVGPSGGDTWLEVGQTNPIVTFCAAENSFSDYVPGVQYRVTGQCLVFVVDPDEYKRPVLWFGSGEWTGSDTSGVWQDIDWLVYYDESWASGFYVGANWIGEYPDEFVAFNNLVIVPAADGPEGDGTSAWTPGGGATLTKVVE
jgi:hypothetical protein